MNGFDLSTISAAYLGSVSINEIYLGSVKIWPAGLPIGTTYNFDYTGTVQSQELPAGTYKLQVWGAQGGSSTGDYAATGSKGGYSEGILKLTQTTTLYIFVGGAGGSIASSSTSTTVVNGGWNGGGGAKPYNYVGTGPSRAYSYPRAGGGATDIALVTSSMTYSSNRTNRSSDSLLSRIIVAGGGGGSSYIRKTGGSSYSYASTGVSVGGGTSGGGQYGGSQSSAGTGGGFGYGGIQNSSSSVMPGAGGGGWYGGGSSNAAQATSQTVNYNGGGSGFVNTSENAQYRPTGYTGLELDFGATYAGDTSFPSTSTGNETGHSGDGYARITCIKPVSPLLRTPLTFDILSDGVIIWKRANSSSPTRTIQYKKNDGSWTSITSSTSGVTISVSAGDVVQFIGDNTNYATTNNVDACNSFHSTCTFNVRGNIMSLFKSSGFGYLTTLPSTYSIPYLFYNTGVVDASGLILPATTMTDYCYMGLFQSCTSLTNAPSLPATTMADACYADMFLGCTSLATAPELPATTLVDNCYYSMFYECSNLNYIKCLAKDISAYDCTTGWVYGVADSGTFVAHPSADWTRGNNGIPTNWNVQLANVPLSEQYLTFDILGSGTIGWSYSSSSNGATIKYRKNYGDWTTLYSTASSGTTISVVNGDVIQFKNDRNSSYGSSSSSYYSFTATCNFNAKGNIMSLHNSSSFSSLTTIPGTYDFYRLFMSNENLIDASELIMPATTLKDYCYFAMFSGCTNLIKAPVLPASSLSQHCYNQMFYGCTSLNYVKCLATNISANMCTNNWLNNVASTGTFVKASTMSSWTTGNSGIPSGWTVENA